MLMPPKRKTLKKWISVGVLVCTIFAYIVFVLPLTIFSIKLRGND